MIHPGAESTSEIFVKSNRRNTSSISSRVNPKTIHKPINAPADTPSHSFTQHRQFLLLSALSTPICVITFTPPPQRYNLFGNILLGAKKDLTILSRITPKMQGGGGGSGDPVYTPQLKMSELYRKRESRDSARLRAYNKILETIHHRIRVMSQLPNAQTNILFTIPPFILGLPRIDLEDCVVYLVYQLRMTGFQIRYTFPNLLYIDWSHHEKSYILEQSPIMMAMLESDERKREEERRKSSLIKRPTAPSKKKVAFANEVLIGGNTANNGRDFGAPSVGRLPSASEYIPPSTFLKQMIEPTKKPGPFDDLWK
jgi:hypothetical protein